MEKTIKTYKETVALATKAQEKAARAALTAERIQREMQARAEKEPFTAGWAVHHAKQAQKQATKANEKAEEAIKRANDARLKWVVAIKGTNEEAQAEVEMERASEAAEQAYLYAEQAENEELEAEAEARAAGAEANQTVGLDDEKNQQTNQTEEQTEEQSMEDLLTEWEAEAAKAEAEAAEAEARAREARANAESIKRRLAEAKGEQVKPSKKPRRRKATTIAQKLIAKRPAYAGYILELARAVDKNRGSKEATRKIKEWYQGWNPEEFTIPEMNPDLTFEQMAEALLRGESPYDALGVHDSTPRENIFGYLADGVYKVSYDAIYYTWLAN